jgi:hypothetical protein
MSNDIQVVITEEQLSAIIESGTIVVQGGGGGVHNNLLGLQGGTTDEFYHLTLAQFTKILNNAYLEKAGDTMSGVLDMGDNNIIDVGGIQLNLVNGQSPAEGLFKWNPTDGTANLGLKGGTVNLQIGQELVIRVLNKTGSTILNGTGGRINGVQGQRPTAEPTQFSNPRNGATGIFTESIANNDEGYLTIHGTVRGLDTSAFTGGLPLFADPTNPGGFTHTPPSDGSRIVLMGLCINSHPTDGDILVQVINGIFLDELSDTTITNPQDGDGLFYQAGTGMWINQAP